MKNPLSKDKLVPKNLMDKFIIDGLDPNKGIKPLVDEGGFGSTIEVMEPKKIDARQQAINEFIQRQRLGRSASTNDVFRDMAQNSQAAQARHIREHKQKIKSEIERQKAQQRMRNQGQVENENTPDEFDKILQTNWAQKAEDKGITELPSERLLDANDNVVPAEPCMQCDKESGIDKKEQEPVYDEVEEFALESDYAVKQLQIMTKKDSQIVFTYVIKRVFGEYFNIATIEKLCRDALESPLLLNPEIIVTKIAIKGESAAYDNDRQKILISQRFIEKALKDNYTMGELLVALVEETGHHIDWLLRNRYTDRQEEEKQFPPREKRGDVGAKFAHQVININMLETQEQNFATLTSTTRELKDDEVQNEHQDQQALIWEYRELHSNLTHHVNEARQNRDDSGNYNFFKAGTIEGHSKVGHQDLEDRALKPIVIEYSGDNDTKVEEILHRIYLGNWLRDYSQVIDPGIIRPMSNNIIARSKRAPGAAKPHPTDDPHNVESRIEIRLPLLGFNLIKESFDVQPITWSRRLLTIFVKFLAMSEFMEVKKKKFYIHNFENQIAIFEQHFFEINEEKLGVYRPDEHIDNPKTDPIDKNDRNPCLNTGDEYGFVGRPTELELAIGEIYGMKNYIRSHLDSANFSTERTAYEYIEQQIYKASVNNHNFDNAIAMADFGAALHVIEDYFAHTNFTEIALAKVSENDRIFPWVDEVPVPPRYKNKGMQAFNYDVFAKKEPKEANEYLLSPETCSVIDGRDARVDRQVGKFNQISRFIPVVTGTFGELDMLASLIPVLQEHVFSYTIDPYKFAAPGERTAGDILLLEMAKEMDKIQAEESKEPNNDSYLEKLLEHFGINDETYAESFKRYLLMRDKIQWVKGKVPEPIRESAHYVLERIGAMVNFGFYMLLKVTASKIQDVQLLMQEQIQAIEQGKFAIGTDPSHTQVAKDDPSKPMHELAGELAIHAVKEVGEIMFKVWQGKASPEQVMRRVAEIMQHPAKCTWQDKIVSDWSEVKENKEYMCAASTPSAVIDSIIHSIKEIQKFNKGLIEYLTKGNKGYDAMQSILEVFDPDGILLENLQILLGNGEKLLAEANRVAAERYNKTYHKPPQCRNRSR